MAQTHTASDILRTIDIYTAREQELNKESNAYTRYITQTRVTKSKITLHHYVWRGYQEDYTQDELTLIPTASVKRYLKSEFDQRQQRGDMRSGLDLSELVELLQRASRFDKLKALID